MEHLIQQAVSERLKEILHRDSQRPNPVVQSVSLFFWQNLSRWVRQIALMPEPFTIAISGPSGSGKSFIRQTLVEQLALISEVSSFTQDNYYRDFETDFPHLSLDCFYDEINLDDPAHIRFRQLGQDLQRMRDLPLGSLMKIQKLRFGTPTSKPTIIEEGLEIRVAPFIITEGIHAFCEPSIFHHYDLKIYVDVDEHSRRERWLERNRRENRGTTDNMWNTTVDCLQKYILPTRSVADLVVNNMAEREQVAAFLEELVSVLAAPLEHARKEIA